MFIYGGGGIIGCRRCAFVPMQALRCVRQSRRIALAHDAYNGAISHHKGNEWNFWQI